MYTVAIFACIARATRASALAMTDWEDLALGGTDLTDTDDDDPEEGAPLPEQPGTSSGGWDDLVTTSIHEATQSVAAPAPEGSPPPVMPKAGSKRKGRRSKLLVEALQGAQPVAPRMSRQEALEKARAAKAAKRQRLLDAAPAEGSGAAAQPERALALPFARPVELPGPIPEAELRLTEGHAPRPFSFSPLGSHVEAASKTYLRDEKVAAVLDEYCRQPESTVSTLTVKAATVGVNRRDLRTMLSHIGSALVAADHMHFRDLQRCFTVGNLVPLLFIDSAPYDETPMWMRTRE